MKRLTNRLFFNRSLFRKQLLSYFITVLIPTMMIVSVYSYTLSDDLTSQIQQASDNSIQRVNKNMETLIDQINYFSLQLSFIPNMSTMLQDPADFNMFDYYQLKEQLRNQIIPNKLFYSMYIYAAQNGKIMTTNEGLFNAESFYDKPVLEQIKLHGSDSFWYQVREDYVSFYKSIPVTAPKPLGTLVINIQKDMFLSTIYNMNYVANNQILLVDSDGHVISQNEDDKSKAVSKLIADKTTIPSNNMQKIRIGKQLYFVHTHTTEFNGWKVVNLIPYELYKERLLEKMSKLLVMVLIVFFIGLAIAYSFAVKMYNPWKKIIEVLSGSSNNLQASDEYSIVSGAISIMMDTIKLNEPVMKDHLISDILRNNISDKRTIPARLEQIGISFRESDYAVIVAVMDAMRQEDAEDPQQRLITYSLVSETLKKYVPAEGTILDGSKLGFIVNVNKSSMDDDWRETINRCFAEVNALAQEQLNVSLQLCIGEICSADRIHVSYEHIRRMLNYKAVINKNDVIFIQDHQTEMKFVYPLSIQKQLIHAVVSLNREKAIQCVDDLFEQYIYHSKYPHEKLQGMIVVLMSSVLNELIKEGHDIGSLNEEAEIFKLNECQNNDELREFMITHIGKIIVFLESLQDRQINNFYVSKTIAFMEAQYASNISIKDIADHVEVSSGHLSRTFKAAVGKSMLEFLTEYRIKKSKELLAGRNDPLHEISQAVGYNDVQSFIRFFKKYEGITPGEYRKSIHI